MQGLHSFLPCRHALLAQEAADALASGFVEATSDMYNNITDYVLGPMHGYSAPRSQTIRPLPTPVQSPDTPCHDDSDSDDDDEGPSGGSQRIQLPTRTQSRSPKELDSITPAPTGDPVLQSSLDILPFSTDFEPNRPSPSHSEDGEGLSDMHAAPASLQTTAPCTTQQAGQHDVPQKPEAHAESSDVQQTIHQSKSSEPQSSEAQPQPQQASASQVQDSEAEQASQGEDTKLRWQRYADSSSRITTLRATPQLLVKAVKLLAQQPLPPIVAIGIRQLLSHDEAWPPHQTRQKPSTSSPHEGVHDAANKSQGGVSDSKQGKQGKSGSKGEFVDKSYDGKHSDSLHEGEKHMGSKGDFSSPGQDDCMAYKSSAYKQHWFLLTFLDPHMEKDYRVWQARHRTKVILWSPNVQLGSPAKLQALHGTEAEVLPCNQAPESRDCTAMIACSRPYLFAWEHKHPAAFELTCSMHFQVVPHS